MGIPVERVLEKLDAYFNKKDYPAAERHLQYWLSEAALTGDRQGRLTILNEQIGFYRKLRQEPEAMTACSMALEAAEELGLDGTVGYATTLLNAATAYKAFGRAEEALPLYERAKEIYEAKLLPEDGRRGGLYNNMALTLVDLGRYSEAEALFEQALSVMAQVSGGEPEMAVTHCNLADLADLEQNRDLCLRHLDAAWALLHTPGLRQDGYFAFVCEKCAPAFGTFGQPEREAALLKLAEAGYQNP